MNKRWGALVAVTLLAGVWSAHAGVNLGEPPPQSDLKMKNVDGRRVSIKEAAGSNGLMVVFWCRHCPFVKAWESRLTALGNEAVGKGVGVILINANDPVAYPEDSWTNMQAQAKQAGYRFPYVVDETSDVARAFGATRTPEVFLFDAGLKLVYQGAIDDNPHRPEEVTKHYLRDAVKALTEGGQIPVNKTSSVGCSIKFRKAVDK